MLYFLSALSDGGDIFNLFRYITFRAGGAFFTALVFGFVFGRPMINMLKRMQVKGQPIREDGPESHLLTKVGTPTMGGRIPRLQRRTSLSELPVHSVCDDCHCRLCQCGEPDGRP